MIMFNLYQFNDKQQVLYKYKYKYKYIYQLFVETKKRFVLVNKQKGRIMTLLRHCQNKE